MIEWFIVVALFTPDGASHVTYRQGFPTKERCEAELAVDMRTTFGALPAAKGVCLDFPNRPVGLQQPAQPAPRRGTTNT